MASEESLTLQAGSGDISRGNGANGHRQDTAGKPLRGKQLAATVTGLLLGMLLAALDQTIVSTAMPKIFGELGGAQQDYSWVFTAYLLTSTVTVPIYGKLSDIWGRKWFFMGGIVIFLVGSALSGASQNVTQLILFRAAQGIGAGAMMPIAFAIIGDLFPPAERGKWQGLFSGVFGLASIVGPALGGYITDHFTWRWIFYINLPIGIVALTVLWLTLPVFRNPQASRKIDYLGTALLIVGITPLLIGFSLVGTGPGLYAWGSVQIITLFSIAGAALLAFIFWELFGASSPVLDLRLFKNSIFTVSIIITIMVGAAMFGTILFIPLFLQNVTGVSATNSGTLLAPLMGGWVVASIISGQILSRWGRYRVMALVGMALSAIGMFLMTLITVSTAQLDVVRNMIILGLGMGASFALFTIIVQNAFPIQRIGVVTAALTFFRAIAQTVGTAIFGFLVTNQFNNVFPGQLAAAFPKGTPQSALNQFQQNFSNYNLLSAPPNVTNQIHQGIAQQAAAQLAQQHVPAAQIPTLADRLATQTLGHLFTALKYSLTSGLQQVFLVAFVLMVIAFVVCLFLKEIPLRKSGGAAGMASLAEGGHASGDEVAVEAAHNGHEALDVRSLLASEEQHLAAVEEERGTPEIIGPPLGDD
ncbi:MAG TPA: MDR family MFS transporter [Ktedonobacterales bacterium]|nr:MDR family MFS transporter [Ktedonobacterales bacterium]